MEILREIQEKVITNEWIQSKSKGNSGVGITLESLLNKERENFEIPDYKGVELKAKCSKKENYITLFCATPDSHLFEIKRLLQKYGYPDSQYPEFKIFNLPIYGTRKIKLNNNYFKLVIDRKRQKIILRIYDNKFNVVDELTSWSFDMIQEKLERKLNRLALVHADRKFEHNVVYFKYKNIEFYQLTSFERFITLIEYGIIRITFRIGIHKDKQKLGKTYDHGTSFSINEYDISRLFDRLYLNHEEK
ncbi:MAG: MvaI/BcnI family restriction endonuclease [bacterium]|nr:MvaI/BcnI family restriction endonuclease [bacterium]